MSSAKVAPALKISKPYHHPLEKEPYPHGRTVLGTPDDVEHEEIFHTNHLGLKLCVQRWRRKCDLKTGPKAAVVCLHGLNTHAGYTFASYPDYHYKESAIEAWVNRGFAVYCPDHQGHGKSEGVKGFAGTVRSFDDIAHDQKLILRDVVRKDYPLPPGVRNHADSMNTGTGRGTSVGGGGTVGDAAAEVAETSKESNDGAAGGAHVVPVFLLGHCMGGSHLLRTVQIKPDLFVDGIPLTEEEQKAVEQQQLQQEEQGQESAPVVIPDNDHGVHYQYDGVILTAPSWRLAEANKPSECLMSLLRCLAGCAPSMIVANWYVCCFEGGFDSGSGIFSVAGMLALGPLCMRTS